MGVDSRHDQYGIAQSDWKRCRDATEGERAVHAAGVVYLPALSKQTDDEYKAYVTRASFYGATGRTIEAMTGMLFRNPPSIEAPESSEPFTDDMTMGGQNLTSFADTLAEDILTVGRVGVLVDFQRNAPNGLTVAQAEEMKLRPFAVRYRAEQIINWRQDDASKALLYVVLTECEPDYSEDPYNPKSRDIRRVLKLGVEKDDAPGTKPKYVQEIWEKPKNGSTHDEWILRETIVPLRAGAPIDYVPFFFIGPQDSRVDVVKPPVLDLVNVNLSHYRTVADLEHGAHYTALPTAYVTGVTKDQFPDGLSIGAARAWLLPENAKADFLEFTGAGLGALEKLIARKEAQMAILGGRMLAPEKRSVESGEAAAIHREADTSILGSLASSLSDALTAILEEMLLWAGTEAEAEVTISSEFLPQNVDAPMLTALVSAVQQGKMSFETFYRQLQRGDIADPEVDVDEEKDRIKDTQDEMGGQGMQPGVDEDGNPIDAHGNPLDENGLPIKQPGSDDGQQDE